MKKSEVLHAWLKILGGRAPSLSIEITKECPLRCPGCYAFDAAHLGGTAQLRELSDFKGEELVAKVLALIDKHKPLHVSLVGGDPAGAVPRGRHVVATNRQPWRAHTGRHKRIQGHTRYLDEHQEAEHCGLC